MPAAPDLVITRARIATPASLIEDGWLTVHNGLITEIGTGEAPLGTTWSAAGSLILPGFIDMHCHGGGGGGFSMSTMDDIMEGINTHRRHGTTTMLASLVSNSIPELCGQIKVLGSLVHQGELAGVHLEGPFLSPAQYGAHDRRTLVDPDPAVLATLLKAADGAIRMVTLAPELSGGIAAVRQLVAAGVIAAIGHTNGGENEIRDAVDAGATVATHLFNGMPLLHHRRPGPAGILLEDERITIELICDLVHVHPTMLRIAAQYAGPERTILVTDAMAATDATDGSYHLGKVDVNVQNGVATLTSSHALAGSTLTMDVAFRNLVQSAGLSLLDAVKAASTKPAELLGIAKDTGALIPGLAADLVVLDDDLLLRRVLRGGRWV